MFACTSSIEAPDNLEHSRLFGLVSVYDLHRCAAVQLAGELSRGEGCRGGALLNNSGSKPYRCYKQFLANIIHFNNFNHFLNCLYDFPGNKL